MSEQVVQEWCDMQLDSRITEALHDLKWRKPTTVQSACVPLALKGKDIAVQSRTGSGKTGAFVIPIIQHLLNTRERRKASSATTTPSLAKAKFAAASSLSSTSENPVALILVPSVELCEQTVEITELIAKYIKPRLVIDNLTSHLAGSNVASNTGGGGVLARMQSAHIVVSTAALLSRHIRNGSLPSYVFAHIRFLVMDEADMLLAVAEHAIRVVQSVLPTRAMQVILSSATLTDGVAAVKGQLLHNPVNVILSTTVENETNTTKHTDGEEDNDNNSTNNVMSYTSEERQLYKSKSNSTNIKNNASKEMTPIVESRIVLRDHDVKTLKQYYLIATDECHKHTLLFALYRFSLLQGKTLIFVDEEDDTYKLQHFLEQLGIATLVYDTSLPVNVRLDTLRQFQRGKICTLVCTDGTLESAEQLQLSLNETNTSSVSNYVEKEEENKEYEYNTKNDEEEGDGEVERSKTRKGKNGKESLKRARTHSLQHRYNKNNNSNEELPSALHRGIDFAQVRNVILFDGVEASSPLALSRYTHRIGRVGRAGVKGMAITLFNLSQAKKYTRLLQKYCKSRGDALAPFRPLQRQEAAKLQYRVDSVLMNVTRTSTRKLRVATVAAELGKSSYLTHHLSSRDNEVLQRVVRRSAKRIKVERDMLQIPSYMNIHHADDVQAYTRRVQANQTRARNFRQAIEQSSSANRNSKKINLNKTKSVSSSSSEANNNSNTNRRQNSRHGKNIDPLQAMASRLRASRNRK